MFILVKGSEQVALRDEDSARMLAYALSDYNCEDAIKRKIIIGSEPLAENFTISFDERRIVAISQADALKVADWMFGLGVIDVNIRKENEDGREENNRD